MEDRRGSKRARLYCVGRDIEYREIKLERNEDNLWEMTADSLTRQLPEERLVHLLSAVLSDGAWVGTPTELSNRIDPVGVEGLTPKSVSRKILQSVGALEKAGITVAARRSNGKRLIELHRAASDDGQAPGTVDPIDPGTEVEGTMEFLSFGEGKQSACPPLAVLAQENAGVARTH